MMKVLSSPLLLLSALLLAITAVLAAPTEVGQVRVGVPQQPTPSELSTLAERDIAERATSNFQQIMIDLHNQDRAKHSAPPLSWDPTLAAAAKKWAAGCKFQHTPNNPYGQNLAAGTASNFGAKSSIGLWYAEEKDYDYKAAKFSSATGHFTQLVWKATTKIGCALKTCPASELGFQGYSGNARYVVCNYDPPGNYQGQFKKNVTKN